MADSISFAPSVTFTPYFPGPPLNRYIVCFWYVEGMTPYRRERILPTENIELIINLGDPHRVYENDQSDVYRLNKDYWICGIQTAPIITAAVNRSHLIGVRFKPGGVYPFLQRPLSELRDLIVDLDLIWGGQIELLREQLFNLPTRLDRFALLEQWLLKLLSVDVAGLAAVDYAVGHLLRAESPLTVKSLSEEIGWSQKHLIRQCQKLVGVTPKLLSRIGRFHRMLNTVDPHSTINWAAVAVDNGFYDQAHLNKEFAAFAGVSPTVYLQQRQSHFDTPPEQGESVQFVPID